MSLSFNQKLTFLILPLLTAFLALFIGRYHIEPAMVITLLSHPHISPNSDQIVLLQLRLPRIILALLIGSGLAGSGATVQGIFNNPLVSPHILGVAAGAGLGGVLGLLFNLPPSIIVLLGFTTGLMAMGITTTIAGGRHARPLKLVLAGIIVSTFATALISGIKLLADPYDQLPNMVWWLMGSLSQATWPKVFIASPILIGLLLLFILRWQLNLISLGSNQSFTNPRQQYRLRWLLLVTVTSITAIAVALTGIIGWIGLVIPHIARLFVGTNYRVLIPACISLGATYLIITDTLARSLTAQEIPVGIITALIGAVIFAWLLIRKT